MPQIKIDPRYWETIKKEYSDWRFAWGREAGQNSLDAGATAINIKVDDAGDKVRILFEDNGCGMNEDTIVNKFLAMGGTGKGFEGSTGGFGKAKDLLAFSQDEYEIHSQDVVVKGQHDFYELIKSETPIHGTKLVVIVSDVRKCTIKSRLREWIENTSTDCAITLNGETVQAAPAIDSSHIRREADWCTVCEHGNHVHYVHIRINGQLMYQRYTSVNASIVIELKGRDSWQYMTANRDGMQYDWQCKLDKMIERIFSNPESVFELDVGDIKVWKGSKGRISLSGGDILEEELEESDKISKRGDSHSVPQPTPTQQDQPYDTGSVNTSDVGMPIGNIAPRMLPKPKPIDGNDLVCVNMLNREVPSQFMPSGELDEYASRLINRWNSILKTVGRILDRKETIATGWVFKLNQEAGFMNLADIGMAILINPVKINDKNQYEPRWDMGWASFNFMVSAAIHEITHINYSWHGDQFANACSANEAKVRCHQKALNMLFASGRV